MAGNPGMDVEVRYKVESVFGTPVVGAGGEMLRCHAGNGLTMPRSQIEDPEIRGDGMESMMRLGGKSVTGSYAGTLSVGTFNTFLSALFRHAWVATAVKFTCDGGAAHTSLAVTLTNTLTLAGTDSFITTHGVRVGDVIRVGAMGAGTDSVNAVVATVAANVITVLGTPWANFAADANATFTLMKKLTNAAGTVADPLVRTSYTLEEYFETIDESEQYAGCRVSSMKLTFTPEGVAKVEFGFVGQTMAILTTGNAPGLTTPTEYTSVGLIAADATIYIAGAAIATVTGGELTFDLGAKGINVVGSLVTPDVWEGKMKVRGQITAVRTALTASHLARYIAETDNVEMSVMFVEPDAAVPIDFVHLFLPRIKYIGNTKSWGGDGPVVETIPIMAAAKATTTGYDAVVATMSTSV